VSLGRYLLFDEIASGGMASVHFGRLNGAAGFSRVVAIKRLHPQFATDPDFVSLFFEEARLAARIRHLNVVATLDVVAVEREAFVVMEYIHGQSLSKLWRAAQHSKKGAIEPRIVATIMGGVLRGIHAAHEAKDERGEALRIVHRDVSPQNVLVGVDGVGRVIDFGVAKAAGRRQTTQQGQIKGKLAYMPPEQLQGEVVTRRTDLYSAGVVIWELLTGQRAFSRETEAAVVTAILCESLPPPSTIVPAIPPAFDALVARALAYNPMSRYATALEMAFDLERCVGTASQSEVADWVQQHAVDDLALRAHRMAVIERSSTPPDAEDPAPPKHSGRSTVRPLRPSTDDPNTTASASRGALSTTLRLRRIRRRPLRIITRAAIPAIAALGVLVAAVSLMAHRSSPPTRAPAQFSAPSPAAPVFNAPSPRDDLDAAAKLLPVIPVSALPVASGTRASSRPGAAAPPHGTSPHPVGNSKRDCNPPYVVDADGIKRYKQSCLE
jgi:serine/threonine-protein kinase